MTSKRERQSNFTEEEGNTLIKYIIENSSIIENKETDSDIWKEKNETWNKIDQLMVVSTGIKRGVKSLKNKWEKIKREVKQRLAAEKKEMYMTGGSKAKVWKPLNSYEQIVELLGVSAVGLDSHLDSDCIEVVTNILDQPSTSTKENVNFDFEQMVESPDMFEEVETNDTVHK